MYKGERERTIQIDEAQKGGEKKVKAGRGVWIVSINQRQTAGPRPRAGLALLVTSATTGYLRLLSSPSSNMILHFYLDLFVLIKLVRAFLLST